MQIIAPPTEIIASALQACRRHFVAVAIFSALLNLLFLVPMLYMLQVYDRVIPTRGSLTLFFITLVLLFGLISLAMLDYVRSRLLVRASIRLDRLLAGTLLDTTLARRDLAQCCCRSSASACLAAACSEPSTGRLRR